MSYFIDGIVNVLVPTVDITNEMENNMKRSFNTTRKTARKSLDKTLTLCKLKEPISNVFNVYEWLNTPDMRIKMRSADWQKPQEN